MKSETYLSDLNQTNLRVEDFICLRCDVEVAEDPHSVCESCKALGKSVDGVSEKGVWSDIQFGGTCAKRFIFGLGA